MKFIREIVYRYYLFNPLINDFMELDEDDFYCCVGYDRKLVPMKYHKGNINRQDFFDKNDVLVGYREAFIHVEFI